MATDQSYLTYPRDPVVHDRMHPIFEDRMKAREWLEERMWPDGPVCVDSLRLGIWSQSGHSEHGRTCCSLDPGSE